jgi:cytosolic iron-sulfur assembly component 2
MALLNPTPNVYTVDDDAFGRSAEERQLEFDDDVDDQVDSLEIFDLIRAINDPEHPLTLEQLKVAQLELIEVNESENSIDVHFTPTIPHCSMATLIGLCIRVKLLRSLPPRFKVHIAVTPGSHASERQVNKQLNDKERVAAALENNALLDVVNRCLKNSDLPLDFLDERLVE